MRIVIGFTIACLPWRGSYAAQQLEVNEQS
jgi:hypothetical protein